MLTTSTHTHTTQEKTWAIYRSWQTALSKTGVMQNLTVIPYIGHGEKSPETPADWTVVIGHRRLRSGKNGRA